jgi:hypothetical protein
MIKLKDLLLENDTPNIFIPRRLDDRVERMIKQYIRNGSQGDMNLSGMNLTVLPDILKNVTVSGYFNCSYNNLTSLDGAPKTVGGDFVCTQNQLTSLTGAPKTVGGDFFCFYNTVQFTEQQVKAVCDVKGRVIV